MLLNTHYITRDFSSDPNLGASNVSDLGSTFDVFLNPPINIPKIAKNIYIEPISATVWFNTPNIQEGINDQFKIKYQGTDHTITIPEGLYTVQNLSNKISILLFNEGLPEDLLMLIPDTSTDKLIIEFHYSLTQIDFTINNSLRDLLGFNDRNVPLLPTTEPIFEIADNVAEFNSVDYYYIKCQNLLSRGIATNSDFTGIIVKVPINVGVGEQIRYEPTKSIKIDASELSGVNLTKLTFQLTDNKNRSVPTRGQFFSIQLTIQYQTLQINSI